MDGEWVESGGFEAYKHPPGYADGAVEVNSKDDSEEGYLFIRSRQDCEDLIALLERVKERLPDGK